MRDIKFRVWAKFESGNRGMLDMDNIDDWSIYELLSNEDDDIVMQYTGLKDKNGVEIYEGDVLKLLDNIVHEDGQHFAIGYVYYDVEFACYMMKYRDIEIEKEAAVEDKSLYAMFEYQVIGNIYENPELFKS